MIARAENEIQQFFECRCVLRGAAKNGFEQADGFLSKTVAGEEVDVGERLRNEFLRVVVDRLFHESGNGGAACSARIGFDVAEREVAANFGAVRLLEFRLKRFERLGSGRVRRKKAHFPEDAVKLMFCSFGFRLTTNKLFENFLGAGILPGGVESVAKLREGVRKAEGIAGAAVSLHEPFARLETAGHMRSEACEQMRDNVMLAGINHRDTELGDESHGAIGLARFEFGFGDFLGEREVLFVSFEDAKSK